MASADKDHLEITEHFESPAQTVFDAWVQPDLIRKWLFVGPTSAIKKLEIDAVAGGKFSLLEHEQSNDEYIAHYGEYLKVEPPSLLSFKLFVPKHFEGESVVTIEIKEETEGSTLKFMQTGILPEKAEADWKKMFQMLKFTVDQG